MAVGIKIRRGDKNVARAPPPLARPQEGHRYVRRVRVWSSPGPTRHVYVQLVDDVVGRTLASASTMEADLRAFDGDKTAKAKKVGELVGERAKKAGVDAVVFDRGGNRYHGRVAAIADGAREAGLAL